MGFSKKTYTKEELLPFFDRTRSRGPDMSQILETPSGWLCFHRLAIMGLTDDDELLSGEVLWEGRDLLKMSKKEWFGLRGTDIAMVYQDALSSLNPSMLISAQMKQLTKRGGTRSAEELLELVGLDPKRTLESYPHELSGGQRQRVLIAMALTRDPKLVICDEPTTALDVTVQKQVIKLLNDLQAKLGFAMIFVSHDLALVAEVAHNITVMYAGQVIEQAPTKELLTNPIHEYTRGLLGSVAAQDHQAVQTQFVVILLHGLYLVQSVFIRYAHIFKRLTRASKDRTSAGQDS